jgi:ribosomal protein S18 acetylase RimI-like enzyme
MLVRTRYRGTGIGEGLVRMAMEKASEEQAKRINLLVFEKNRAAVNLYRKMGFCQISIPELDEQLEEEAQKEKRRRIIMSRPVVV